MSTGQIFSIGHGSSTPSRVVEYLKRVQVGFIIDVRSVPYSKFQPDFARECLQAFLCDHGIRYVFMGKNLGGRPRDEACYTGGKVDYMKCQEMGFFQDGISRLLDACSQGLRVCLLCSEGKPWMCHRSKLIGVALTREGISVTHILPGGQEESQRSVIHRLTGGQVDIFSAGRCVARGTSIATG